MINRTIWIRGLIIWAFVTLVWNIHLYFLPEKTTWWNYSYNLIYAGLYGIGGVMGLLAIRKNGSIRSAFGKAIFFLSLGLVFYTAGLVLWSYYNLVLHIDLPYPSICDVFFIFLFVPCMGLGCWYLLSLVKGLLRKEYIIESIGFLVVSGILSFVIHRPDLISETPILIRIMDVAYPLSDSILLSLAMITLRISGGKMHNSMRFFVTGFIVQVVADYVYTYRVASDIYWNGDISDFSYSIAAVILSLGVIILVKDFISQEIVTEKSLQLSG